MWQPRQKIFMPGKDDNALDNFGHHEKEEYILEEQDIEEDQIDLVGESSDTKSHAKDILLGRTL